jgi:4-aminobutyrate aminotransferase-like enzyme
VTTLMRRFDSVSANLDLLPTGVVHHDLNDFNVLAAPDPDGRLVITGVIDVNDSMLTIRVAELAIAVAYAMLRQADPLSAASSVVAGFNTVVALDQREIKVIFPLAGARLCVNATTWKRRTIESHHPYGKERMRHTWPTLHKLAQIPTAEAEARLRVACGLASDEPEPRRSEMNARPVPVPIFGSAELVEIDLSPAGSFFDDRPWTDVRAVGGGIEEVIGDRSVRKAFTRHLSASMLRSAPRRPGQDEPATVQIGLRILAESGESLHAPRDGVVVRADHGGPVIVRHSDAVVDSSTGSYFTCWRGLAANVAAGDEVAAGEPLGTVGVGEDPALGANVLLQVLLDEDLVSDPPPQWVTAGTLPHWNQVTADPAPLLRLTAPARARSMNSDEVVSLRDRRLARSQRAYYKAPPKLVRGRGAWLYDDYARSYLDAINNVSHVGHAEPRITEAATSQLSKLNTNSRFIYEGIATYAERLVATLPPPLEVVFLVCTGSEANDLALRISRQVTGRSDAVVIDGAYHGNTAAVMGISPNRYKGAGGRGAPDTTHEVMRPDVYRGPYGREDPNAGAKYGAEVAKVVDSLVARGRPPAAFIAESLMGTAGNVVFPTGYLKTAFEAARKAGAICISDEVQVGVGRLGSEFWGFQVQGVVPDIVTMGKPLGNGHPVAAVVTTREIADGFDDGVKYFNTFGGNPVSCAIGTAVLDIVEGDNLQSHAGEIGEYFLRSLEGLKSQHAIIGDVRGQGLYLGIELVRDEETKEPAPDEALEISEAMMMNGVIVYPTGVYENVLKLKPPMVFGRDEVDFFVATLDRVLAARSQKHSSTKEG